MRSCHSGREPISIAFFTVGTERRNRCDQDDIARRQQQTKAASQADHPDAEPNRQEFGRLVWVREARPRQCGLHLARLCLPRRQQIVRRPVPSPNTQISLALSRDIAEGLALAVLSSLSGRWRLISRVRCMRHGRGSSRQVGRYAPDPVANIVGHEQRSLPVDGDPDRAA